MGITSVPKGELPASWLGVPVALGERVIGIIAAQSDKIERHFNERHLGLLNAVASQAAIAIENARLFHQEQTRAEQERRVRTITERVRQGADIQSILRITMDELSQILGAEKSAVKLGTREQLLAIENSDNYEAPEAQESIDEER
jgi:GAF domain-containing protein